MSVSTWFVVVRFERGEGWLRENIAVLKSLLISFCGEDSEHDGTKNVVLRDG